MATARHMRRLPLPLPMPSRSSTSQATDGTSSHTPHRLSPPSANCNAESRQSANQSRKAVHSTAAKVPLRAHSVKTEGDCYFFLLFFFTSTVSSQFTSQSLWLASAVAFPVGAKDFVGLGKRGARFPPSIPVGWLANGNGKAQLQSHCCWKAQKQR